MFDLHTHTSKQRAFLLAFVALLLTFALAACGGDDDTDLGAGGLEGDTGVIGEDTGVLEEDTPLTDSTDVTGVDQGVISGDLTSEEYLAELFTVYDTDSNGLLTEDEIAAFLGNNEYLGDPTSIFDTYDENVDAYLDETEFIAFVMDNTDDFGVGPDDAPLEEAGINDPEAADAVTGDTGNGDMGAMVDSQAIDQLITPYDENADGILDESEFNTLLTDYGYMGDTAGLFDQYDANADASLDASEFNTFFTENTSEFDINTFEQNDTLGALFTPYDVNQDTYLDQDEFNAFLTDYGYTGDTAGLFDQYDANADAYLDQDEYLSFTTENITGFGAGGAEDNVVISPLFTPTTPIKTPISMRASSTPLSATMSLTQTRPTSLANMTPTATPTSTKTSSAR